MNKKKVNEYLEYAYDAIQLSGISDKKTKKVKKSFRSQISAFGASISMGSPKAAIAFFSKQGGSDTERPKILHAIYLTLKKDTVSKDENKSLEKKETNTITVNDKEEKGTETTISPVENDCVKKENDDKNLKKECSKAATELFSGLNNEYTTDDIINAAIAVKLAMNLYELDD